MAFDTASTPLAPSLELSPHLRRLESESIDILREVASEFERPVLMYSIGKDSGVLLHLAKKAFFPSKAPFPLLHVDTTWKFAAMIEHRDRMAAEGGFELLVHTNREGVAAGVSPFASGSSEHTRIMKTEALKQALDLHRFDAAIGGARRDEEKSRAKERVVSIRSPGHGWDPRRQRPELWNLYNTRLAPGRDRTGLPAQQLDRAGRVGLHPRRSDPGRAALFRRRAAGGEA